MGKSDLDSLQRDYLRSRKSRRGNPKRRKLEYCAIAAQVKKNKQRLVNRIQRQVIQLGNCLLWNGAKDRSGYGVLSFKYRGQHVKITVPRVVLILKLGKPIPLGFDAGHKCVYGSCIHHIEQQHYSVNANYRPQLF